MDTNRVGYPGYYMELNKELKLKHKRNEQESVHSKPN